jgi:uncharacterized MAPEG superfamily protein
MAAHEKEWIDMLPLELQILAAGVALGIVHIVAASHSASLQRGYRWAAGARDERQGALTGVAGRLARALHNFLETFPFFAALVLAICVTGRSSALSQWGAMLYLAGRIAYLPAYAFGIYLLRSLIWNVAAIGILLLLVALLTADA